MNVHLLFMIFFTADDISSISGSDSEKDDTLDTIAAAQGKIFIENGQNIVFSLYKCLLFDKKVCITQNF